MTYMRHAARLCGEVGPPTVREQTRVAAQHRQSSLPQALWSPGPHDRRQPGLHDVEQRQQRKKLSSLEKRPRAYLSTQRGAQQGSCGVHATACMADSTQGDGRAHLTMSTPQGAVPARAPALILPRRASRRWDSPAMKVLPMSWLSPQLAFHLLPRQACAMGRRIWETSSVRNGVLPYDYVG